MEQDLCVAEPGRVAMAGAEYGHAGSFRSDTVGQSSVPTPAPSGARICGSEELTCVASAAQTSD